eukprot:5473910-Pyramimonas_sp.AAC.1
MAESKEKRTVDDSDDDVTLRPPPTCAKSKKGPAHGEERLRGRVRLQHLQDRMRADCTYDRRRRGQDVDWWR